MTAPPRARIDGLKSHAIDPVSRHRPQGRRLRAPGAGRHGPRHGVQPRPCRAGAELRGRGIRISPSGRSRCGVRRQAGQCEGGRADHRKRALAGAARRRPARHGGHLRLARKGCRPRHHRHRRGARSRLGEGGRAGLSGPHRGRPRRPRRQGGGAGLGGKLGALARWRSRSASRTPASPRSSTPIFPATACSRA